MIPNNDEEMKEYKTMGLVFLGVSLLLFLIITGLTNFTFSLDVPTIVILLMITIGSFLSGATMLIQSYYFRKKQEKEKEQTR